MKRDLSSSLYVDRGISPIAAVTNDTAFVSEIFDTAGYQGVMFAGIFGTNTDSNATFTVLVEDGDVSNLSDNAAVDDAYLTGVEAMGLDFADDNATWKIGYIGPKRYVRVTVTPSGNTGDVFMAGMWIASGARVEPQSTQVT